ncbi:hypothetical protein Cgig2_031778 [Carnegiea gigantea]|uniref:DUF4283 domain-containing protein n=1 Tax=Carnegiea gigantea TaxID=171969 RepID=A0A9Q1JMC4_9CARY|nr:hypothetical protein Cgig2_031778 [Carnegiea gigantea]
MKSVFKSIWKPSKGVVIKEIEKNLFAFQFFSRYDKEFVMNEGSWAFDGCILLLKQMAGWEQPSEVQFTTARLIKDWCLVVGCEDDFLCGVDKSLNFRVDIDITKLLRRGVRITADGNPIWIRLKCVRLPDFCYACGKLGFPEAELQYGGWIRASPLKSRRRNAKEELQEECKLFLAFRNGKGETKMKKLEFGKEMTEDDNVNQKKKALQEGISKMLSMNSPRNDSLKRKVSMGRPREVEKNRIVDDISQVESANSIQAEVAGPFMSLHEPGAVDNLRSLIRGLALLWKKATKVILISYSFHHIDRLTGIYGWPELNKKLCTCDLIRDLHSHSALPWLVGGDVNEIFCNFEKKRVVVKSQALLDVFCATFEECGLFDLGFSGYGYTWESRRGDAEVVEERLDRCIHDEGCRQTVKEAGESFNSQDLWANLEGKLSSCSRALLKWNEDVFGNVTTNIKALERQVREEKNIEKRWDLLNDISVWCRKEEIMWAQRAKANFLNYGNSNSRWFYARPNISYFSAKSAYHVARTLKSSDKPSASSSAGYEGQLIS